MLLARAGLSVLVLDRGREGSDTLSTHAFMRAGVLQLHHWGVLEAVQRSGTPLIRTTSFHYGDEVVTVELKPRDGVDGLYAPRRFVLDKVLVDAARAAGAEVRYGAAVTDVVRAADGRVTGVVVKDRDTGETSEVHGRLIIGADGVRSTLAELVGAQAYRTGAHSTAIVFGYFVDLGIDGYHWYYQPGVSAGVIPTNDGLTCVFASMPSRRFADELHADIAAGHQQVLRECNAELANAVAATRRAESLRGFPGIAGYLRQSWGPGWALVGDAAYFKDPLTAHGMTDAVVDAELVARAAIDGSERAFEACQRARDERSLGFFEATNAIASFEWDLPALKVLHRRLSEEMKREAASVLALHAESS